MRKTSKKHRSQTICKRHKLEVDFSDPVRRKSESQKRHEVQMRRLRAMPRESCATWCKARTATWRVCRRSPWRTRCWDLCGGIRRIKRSRAAAALRCTSSAGDSGHSAPRCSETPPSTRRCAPRRRWSQTWRTGTGTRSSARGCGRRASSGGDGCLRGGGGIRANGGSRKVPIFGNKSHLNSTTAIFLTDCCCSRFGLYTFVASWRLTEVQCDIVPKYVFKRKKTNSIETPNSIIFHWSFSPFQLERDSRINRFLFFRPLWRRTNLGEVGDLCKLHNNCFVKFGMIRHFASYRLVRRHSHGKLLWKIPITF